MAFWCKVMILIWEVDILFVLKLYLNIFFFGICMVVMYLVLFFFYFLFIFFCATMFEVVVSFWALVYVFVFVMISMCMFMKNGLLYVILYVLFENVNILVKFNVMISGLFGLEYVNEWVVITKFGKWVV